jgi:hypothetical protein
VLARKPKAKRARGVGEKGEGRKEEMQGRNLSKQINISREREFQVVLLALHWCLTGCNSSL